ncbi:MAG: hypothetical protein HY921_05295 [Elusimicrobia bacterium]|nr:hypothetical protein [Elusimicrobiota bacterium]
MTMKLTRVFLAFLLLSQPLSGWAGLAGRPGAPGQPRSFAEITGAALRHAPDPGPVQGTIWYVYSSPAELKRASAMLERVQKDNPNAKIVALEQTSVVPFTYSRKTKQTHPNTTPAAYEALWKRMQAEQVDGVLGSNLDIYEYFDGLRDKEKEIAFDIPFGIVGRRFVSIDRPRTSLDPKKLSDPKSLPHEKALHLTARPEALVGRLGGLEVRGSSLKQVASEAAGIKGEGDAYADLSGLKAALSNISLALAGQVDPKHVRTIREKAHLLAKYIDHHNIDVLVIETQEDSEIVGLMKKMGYHTGMPVIWNHTNAPADPSGLNMAAYPGAWLGQAPYVQAASRPTLEAALKEAPLVERLPYNFMDVGGTSIEDFEHQLNGILDRIIPPSRKSGTYDIHLMLTNGNGQKKKGDLNAYGHFAMAVRGPDGKIWVWTVQYNDGGSFTGGLGPIQQMSLAEYLYAMWRLPGATGQPPAFGQTSTADVLDFILHGITESQYAALLNMAMNLNSRHLSGKAHYDFTGFDNCIGIITQLLRAAGFAIVESGTQTPADKTVELMRGFTRRLLDNLIGPMDFSFIVFERPTHASPSGWRIQNTPLGTPYLYFDKPWKNMTWWERVKTVARIAVNPLGFTKVPAMIEAFAGMAPHRVVVGPQSRTLEVKDNPSSPIVLLQRTQAELEGLEPEMADVGRRFYAAQQAILKRLREDTWKHWRYMGISAEKLRDLVPAEEQADLDRELADYDRLRAEQGLKLLDQQIALRKIDFLRLEIADPMRWHSSEMEPVRRAAAEAARLRETLARARRAPTRAEVKRLDDINAMVHNRLERLRRKILQEVGTVPPNDLIRAFRPVSNDLLRQLSNMRLK